MNISFLLYVFCLEKKESKKDQKVAEKLVKSKEFFIYLENPKSKEDIEMEHLFEEEQFEPFINDIEDVNNQLGLDQGMQVEENNILGNKKMIKKAKKPKKNKLFQVNEEGIKFKKTSKQSKNDPKNNNNGKILISETKRQDPFQDPFQDIQKNRRREFKNDIRQNKVLDFTAL